MYVLNYVHDISSLHAITIRVHDNVITIYFIIDERGWVHVFIMSNQYKKNSKILNTIPRMVIISNDNTMQYCIKFAEKI